MKDLKKTDHSCDNISLYARAHEFVDVTILRRITLLPPYRPPPPALSAAYSMNPHENITVNGTP